MSSFQVAHKRRACFQECVVSECVVSECVVYDMLQELQKNEVQKGSKNSECLKTYGANILKPKYILVAAALFIEIFYSQVPAPLLEPL